METQKSWSSYMMESVRSTEPLEMPGVLGDAITYFLVLSEIRPLLARGTQTQTTIHRFLCPGWSCLLPPPLHSCFCKDLQKKSVLHHLLNAAKAITLKWKDPIPSSIAMWLNKVEDGNKLEDLVLTAQNRWERYTKTWFYWNMFIYFDEGKSILNVCSAV